VLFIGYVVVLAVGRLSLFFLA